MRCLGAPWEGTCHDKRAADSETYHLPAGSTLYQDMGFQGFAVDGVVVIQPKKKPRGGTLTAEEQEETVVSLAFEFASSMRSVVLSDAAS